MEKYIIQTLVSYETAQYGKALTFIFQQFSVNIKKDFEFSGKTGH